MNARKIFLLLMPVLFTLGVATRSYADATIQERSATITKIVGNTITVKTRDGREVTTDVRSPARLKIGDRVVIRQAAPGQSKFIIDDNK